MGFRNFRNMKKLALFLSMALVLTACKKDKSEPETTPADTPLEARKKLLMNARWVVQKMETRVLIETDTLQFDVTPSAGCAIDNEHEYHSSGYLKVHSGYNLCYTGEPLLDTLETWQLPNELQILETSIENGYYAYWDIEQLDEHTLRVATGKVDTNGNHRNFVTYTNIQ